MTPQNIDHNNTFPCTFLCHAQHGLIIAFEKWLKNSFKLSRAKKTKSLFDAVDLYTLQCTERGERGVMAKRGLRASKLWLPLILGFTLKCVRVCICGCVFVSVSMALCMCVCVFVCVSYLAIEQLFGQSGGAASDLPHILRYQLSFTSLVRPPFFGMKPSLETSNKNWETRLFSSFWRHHQLSFCLLWLKYLLTQFGYEVHEEWEMKLIFSPPSNIVVCTILILAVKRPNPIQSWKVSFSSKSAISS